MTDGLDGLKAFEDRSGTNEADQPTQKLLIEREGIQIYARPGG